MTNPIEIPNQIPAIVLSHAVLFPNSLLPLHIFEEKYRDMLADCLQGERFFGVAHALPIMNPDLVIPDIAPVMGVGVIRACVTREDGTLDLILQGLARVQIEGEIEGTAYRIFQTELLQTQVEDAVQVKALSDKLKEMAHALSDQGYQLSQQMDQYLKNVDDPEIIGDMMASAFVEHPWLRQEILDTATLDDRLELVLAAMQALMDQAAG